MAMTRKTIHHVIPFTESPPYELSGDRQHYASSFGKLKLRDYDLRQTRLSHIMEALSIARHNRINRDCIIPKLLDHAFGANIPFESDIFDNAWLDGEADEMLEQVKDAFENMWHAEWESIPDETQYHNHEKRKHGDGGETERTKRMNAT